MYSIQSHVVKDVIYLVLTFTNNTDHYDNNIIVW